MKKAVYTSTDPTQQDALLFSMFKIAEKETEQKMIATFAYGLRTQYTMTAMCSNANTPK